MLSKYTGWGISELKEMEISELSFWIREAERLAEYESEKMREATS